ncbi:hypothetical protein B0H19DRAFT_1074662 [Mycena capillaripes]|nr:hypothetical protein B0H19DRAFT_1074662 [Mycena capillaripes]
MKNLSRTFNTQLSMASQTPPSRAGGKGLMYSVESKESAGLEVFTYRVPANVEPELPILVTAQHLIARFRAKHNGAADSEAFSDEINSARAAMVDFVNFPEKESRSVIALRDRSANLLTVSSVRGRVINGDPKYKITANQWLVRVYKNALASAKKLKERNARQPTDSKTSSSPTQKPAQFTAQ